MSKMPLSRRNLGQMVADNLLQRVREGVYSPGEKLPPQRELMEEFDVGASVIREAVQALAVMGVVDARPGRGTTVLSVPSESAMSVDTVAALLEDQALRDLVEFRRLIEVEIAGLAAERGDEADLSDLGAALEAFRLQVELGEQVYEADIAFHRALAVATQNSIYVNTLDALGDLLAVARQRTESVPGTVEKALVEHTSIYDAVIARDPRRARDAMRGHLQTVVRATEKSSRSLAARSATDEGVE